MPTVLLVGMIALLIGASFIPNKPDITNGLICVGLMIVGIVCAFIKSKKSAAVTGPLKAIDFETIGLLFGLFLVIGGITNMGVIDAVADLLAQVSGGNLFLIYTVILWASVLFSAFIDNIPYVGHHAARGHRPGQLAGGRPHAFVLWPAFRRDAGRQLHPHWRFGQHHRHRHPPEERVRGEEQGLFAHRHSLYAGRGHSRLHLLLDFLWRLTENSQRKKSALPAKPPRTVLPAGRFVFCEKSGGTGPPERPLCGACGRAG